MSIYDELNVKFPMNPLGIYESELYERGVKTLEQELEEFQNGGNDEVFIYAHFAPKRLAFDNTRLWIHKDTSVFDNDAIELLVNENAMPVILRKVEGKTSIEIKVPSWLESQLLLSLSESFSTTMNNDLLADIGADNFLAEFVPATLMSATDVKTHKSTINRY